MNSTGSQGAKSEKVKTTRSNPPEPPGRRIWFICLSSACGLSCYSYFLLFVAFKQTTKQTSGSVWESNPLRALFKPSTGFEDQGPHQRCKHSQEANVFLL